MLVAGSVGPLGGADAGRAAPARAAVRAAFRETIDGLLEGGVDLFQFETFSLLAHLAIAIEEARDASADLPIIAMLTFGEDVELPDGTLPFAAARPARRHGRRCHRRELRRRAAGLPRRAVGDGRRRPGRSSRTPGCRSGSRASSCTPPAPDYLAAMTARFVDAGAAIVGGCCGTTPDHIRAMRAALDALGPGAHADGGRRAAPDQHAHRHSAARRRLETPCRRPACCGRSATRRFVISVEIDPPRSIRIERTIDAARLLQAAGVDAVNISDSAMARVRMGAMAVAFGIQHDLDLECLIHFTTRDRNLMAIESELLGAHALGVRNILALTGDPPRVGEYPSGTGRLGRGLDRPRRDPRPPQSGRGRGRQPDRGAGRLHDRLRAGPDGRRRRDRMGPPRAQDRGRARTSS